MTENEFKELVGWTNGPCAKREVRATIMTAHGIAHVGTNGCMRPQQTCPRVEAGMPEGVGYALCRSVCEQRGHAEAMALVSAKNYWSDPNPDGHKRREFGDMTLREAMRGATMYVEGHVRACADCQRKTRMAGIETDIVFGPPHGHLEPPAVNLDEVDFAAICKAAAESEWLPAEATRNDWVPWVCDWLRDDRPTIPAELFDGYAVLMELAAYTRAVPPINVAQMEAVLDTVVRLIRRRTNR